MNNPGAEITFGVPHSERMMKNDHNQSFYQNQTDIQRQMRLNPPKLQPYEVQQRRNEMDQVLAYELINKAYIQQQPNYTALALMPLQQVPFSALNFQPSFSNQLSAMVVPNINEISALQGKDVCLKCQTSAPVVMKKQAGKVTYRWCCILTFVGACCVPFCVDSCLDIHFICSNCLYHKQVVPATYRCL